MNSSEVTMQRVLTRRTFLEQAGATAASLTLVGRTARAQSAMFISLNGSVAPARTDLRPNGVGPWPEAARLAARIGYGGIDWSLGPAKTAGLEATRALFTELKIQPTIVGLPMNAQVAFGDEAAFKQALPQLADDAAFVAGVGCRRMMLVLTPRSDQPKDERRTIVRDRLSVIAGVLATSNIRLGLEFLGPLYMRMGGPGGGRGGAPAATQTPPAPMQPFIWTLPETVELGKDSGPNVGAVLDVWHWYHSGGTVEDILATDKSRIVHVHLSDAREMPPADVRDNMRLMPGEGVVNLTGFLRALQKIGYDGGVAPEPLGRIAPDMGAEEAARLAYETTAAVMKKAGVSTA
jgi:sugar phosphate isomerase/epimerase